MTVGEIALVIDTYQKKRDDNLKNSLILNYALASNISQLVSCSLSGKTPPSLQELYPNIFLNEDDKKEQDKQEYLKCMLYKEQFIDFANRHNAKRKKGG